MPPGARLRVAAGVLLALAAAGGLILVASRTLPGPGLAAVSLLLLAAAALALDALWPRVNLFVPAAVSAPQKGGEGAVALTFDDGPVEPWTAQVLDVLERHGARATFFCIGGNVEKAPALARAIVERGHAIGGHTESHRSLLFAGPGTVKREIGGGQEAIRRATGVEPHLFRCPRGYKNPFVALEVRRRGLRLVGYSYPVWDVENPSPREIAERVLRRVRSGDVIVMHDGYPPSRPGARDGLVGALPIILEGLRERGLRTVTLGREREPG